MAVTGLPTPPTAYVQAQGSSSISPFGPIIWVKGKAALAAAGYLALQTKTSSQIYWAGDSSTSAITPTVTIRSSIPLTGESTMTVNAGVNQINSSFDGGFHVESFGKLDVLTVLDNPNNIRFLMSVTPTMSTPVIVAGKPTSPTTVGITTSPMTTAGTYALTAAPAPASVDNMLPVAATWRWLATDVAGDNGANFTTWPEHSGSGPSWNSDFAFSPTIITLSHYDTVLKTDTSMGRCVNFYWRYAQHMGLRMDAAHRMTTAQPFTMQFVIQTYPMTATQFHHIFDAGVMVPNGYYTDPITGVVELISDAVYQNKTVPIDDGQGTNRAYFGLRPGLVETMFTNAPNIARRATANIVAGKQMVYTVVFNAGAASAVYIRGFGIKEILAADTRTSVVNEFILGRAMNRIGSTSAARMVVWEMCYFNRVLSEDEVWLNSHWLSGVYNFAAFIK